MPNFQLKMGNDKLEQADAIPDGQYELRLVGFKPAKSRKGDSINLNASYVVVNNPEYNNRRIFDNMNTGIQRFWGDACHGLGLPMETDGKDSWLPGNWEGEGWDKPETMKYTGPLVGRVTKVELTSDSFGNKIRRFFCAVPDCATKFPKIKHTENMVKQSS